MFVGLTVSCSSEKVDSAPQEIAIAPEPNFRGATPQNHPFYKSIYSDYDNIEFEDVDRAYKNHLLRDVNKDYTTNLKNEAFLLLIKKGLIRSGSDKQKRFYLNEQQQLTLNLPCINQFYSLLLSSHNFIKWDEMHMMAKAFYEKNKIIIETSQWPNEDDKQSSLTNLESGYQDFYTNSLFIKK